MSKEPPRPAVRERRARLARFVLPFALALALSAPLLGALASQALAAAPLATAQQPLEHGGEASSPRATMRAYLDAIVRYRQRGKERDLAAAVAQLDLSQIPPLDRDYQGARVANHLLDVLDRVAEVHPDELPGEAEVQGRSTASFAFARTDEHPYRIEVGFAKDESGRWRIDANTVAQVDRWWKALAPVPVLPGLDRSAARVDSLRALVPERFQRTAFLLEHWQWIGLGALVLIGLLVQRIASYLFKLFVERMGRSIHVKLDRGLLERLGHPLAIFITSLAFVTGLPLFDLDEGVFHALNLAANFLLTVAGVWTAYRLVDVLSWYLAQKAALTENKFDDMLVPLLRRTLKIVVVIVGLVFIITQTRKDLWGLVAGLSIGSLAVGFAAKDSIENLFGTFTVLMDKPFQLGDIIKLGDVEGAVEDVGFRSTKVRTPEDSLITIPNSKFIGSLVENRGARRFRRTKTTWDPLESTCRHASLSIL